jgi:NitT/TauT family transport system permease protein
MTRLRDAASTLGFAVLLLAAWQGAVRWGHVPEVILPAPDSIAASLWQGAAILPRHALATAVAALGGFGIALLGGLALAALMALSAVANSLLYPNLLLFQLLPKVALGPLFVVWLGIGLPALVCFAAMVSLFPMAVGTLAGLRAADAGQLRLCQSLGATRWQEFRHVRLPGALPFAFAGAKVAVTMAITGAVVGEFISAQAGLGWLVSQAASRADTALMFAALGVLAAMGAAFYGLVALAEDAARRRWGTP